VPNLVAKLFLMWPTWIILMILSKDEDTLNQLKVTHPSLWRPPIKSDSSLETPYTTSSCGGGDQERALTCYSGLVDKSAQPIGPSRTQRTASPSFEELAAQQGVSPIDDFETLLGEPLPEDESAEEFSALLREWRLEGTDPADSR
jgi:hypothetical protein